MGFERYENNRSIRLKELIDAQDKVSYKDFKRMKYDRKISRKNEFLLDGYKCTF